MGTKIITENFRIQIDPTDPSELGLFRYPVVTTEQAWEDRCNEIREAIKRHIDNIDRVYIKRDRYLVCEFCGEKWEDVVGDKGEPYCCDKAQEEFITKNPQHDWTVFG